MIFYIDYFTKENKKNKNYIPTNALVVYNENGKRLDNKGNVFYDGTASLQNVENSVVCGTSIHIDYLKESCKRTSKLKAFEVHPNLKKYLKD
jgi:hypothetical protein